MVFLVCGYGYYVHAILQVKDFKIYQTKRKSASVLEVNYASRFASCRRLV